MATALPVAGAVAGGTLNYVFMDFYQDMARVHFAIRSLERRHGEEAGVRACFDSLVAQARKRRRSVRRTTPRMETNHRLLRFQQRCDPRVEEMSFLEPALPLFNPLTNCSSMTLSFP